MSISTPARVGLFTLIALFALGAIIVWKTDIFMTSKGYEMIGSFENIEGLTIGSEIRYRGFKVGKVMRIDPAPHDIRVYSVIDKDIKFPIDSHLRVSYDGIVGLKFLEIRPGVSGEVYATPAVLYGVKTSAIVDFIDIGAQNLIETKKIFSDIRRMIEDPKLQQAIYGTVYTANNVAGEMENLTKELRETNRGIQAIVADPKFQNNVKGTIRETEKTLSSANKFFDSVGSMNVRALGGVDVGSLANAVKGNVDIVQSDRNYLRFGIGEGPTRQVSLLDVLFNSRINDSFGFRLGTINNQLGGGLALYPSRLVTLRGDVYDINNEKVAGAVTTRLWPKIRLGYEYQMEDYMDLAFKGDDLLNQGYRNFTIGILVKPPGARIY
ncbi:MAG: MlaD family protein [Candidatus Margulisbacteria bacterium]|nr:MlaD family protein [Candidatus Margulisiibacteriota bacterium]